MDTNRWKAPSYLSGASEQPSGNDELFQKLMKDVSGGGKMPSKEAPKAAPETETRVAITPVEGSMPASEYADMPIGQVLGKAVTNIPRSGVNTLKQLGEAVFVNPGDTLSAIGDVGKGLYSKAAGAVGVEQDPTQKAETERVVDAIGGMYKDRYTNYGEFAKTLAEDPFAIGMDVATVVPGIGLVSKAPLAGKIAKVASFGDPLAIATKAVSAAPQFVAGALRIPQALATGSPVAALSIGQQLGRTGDKIERNAFLRGTRKDVPLSTVSDQAVDLVQELKKKVQSSYVRGRASLATQELPMGDIRAALNKAESDLGLNTSAFPEVRAVLESMRKQIDESETHPNPAARSAVELDTLKQSLNDIIRLNSKNLGGKIGLVGEVARSVRDTIARADPSYAKMMEDYQQWIEHFKDLKAIGANEGLSETARIQKLLNLLKKEDRLDLLKKLSEGTTAGKELIPMLAGMAFREIAPPAYQGFGLAGLGMLAAQGPHGIGAAALGSPKLAGLSQYALGRAGSMVPQVSSAIPNALVNLEGQRAGFKTGGRVGSHEAEADRLVMAAERAKRGLSAHTEGLLNTPDDAVASALEIANRSI